MPKVSDYTIVPYYSSREPTVEKFKIVLGGRSHSVHKTLELASNMIKNLENDHWYCDRGFTRAERSNW